MVKHITIGCSHTHGTYLPPSDHWINILKEKTGIHFLKIARNAAGLSYLVLLTKQHIEKGAIDPEEVQYVVLQKPKAYRHPFWGKDMSGYRYIKRRKDPEIISQRAGMRIALRKWGRFTPERRKAVSQSIFSDQLELIRELQGMFSQARFAYYRYWADCVSEIVTRPDLAKIDDALAIEAAKLGMDNWGTIIDPKTIKGVYDDGEIIMDNKKLVCDGWIRSNNDSHPMRRHHELVAIKVEEWLSIK